MSSDNAKTVFLNALDIASPEARRAYLNAQYGNDQSLRAEVEGLLRHHEQIAAVGETTSLAKTTSLPAEHPDTQIGPYVLLQQIGEGGMGVVYLAEQLEPVRRHVALKVIKPGMDTRQVIARFDAERQALAVMDHPNIAKVLDAGTTDSGQSYFVMELVRGTPITEYCDEHHLTPRQRLELFLPVCQAIQHAHQKGIIHRDIKPTNILVAEYDQQPVPKVIDFGVAKATSQGLTEKTMFTGLGQIVGTLEYMSPEQAKVNQLDIDTRSDIYSLGVLLYELLTGSTPFDKQRLRSAAFDEMLRIIREEEPPKPSTRLSAADTLASVAANRSIEPARLRKQVRGELDWIVMKCLEKERNRRYETANGLAEDLQHFLHDEPVLACPPSAMYRFRKFSRRNRALLLATSIVVASLVSGIFVSTWQSVRAVYAERRAENSLKMETRESRRATQAAERLTKQNYVHRVSLAQHEWAGNNVGRALQHLDDCPKSLRGWEWFYCHRLCHLDLLTFRGHDAEIRGLAYDPHGKLIASAANDGTVKVWNPATGQVIFTTGAAFPPSGVANTRDYVYCNRLAFSPDGARLALACPDGKLRIFDAQNGKEELSLPAEERDACCVAFSPDGKRFATAGSWSSSVVKVWNANSTAEGTPVLTLPHDGAVSVTFNSDGTRLATAGTDRAAKLWDAKSGTELRTFRGHEGLIYSVAFRGGGESLATASLDQTIRVWDVGSEQPRLVLRGHTGLVRSVAFSPDGARLISGSEDQTIRFWDLRDGRQLFTRRGHTAFVTAVAFSPSGKEIASGSDDGTVKIWEVWRDHEALTLPVGGWVVGVAFSPDGKWVATGKSGDAGGALALWDAATGKKIRGFQRQDHLWLTLTFSPDGKRLASAGRDGTVRIWDPLSGEELLTFRNHEGGADSVTFHPDGKRIASGGGGGLIRLWDSSSGREILSFQGHQVRVRAVLFSPNGNALASIGGDDQVKLWEPMTGRLLKAFPCKVWQDHPNRRYLWTNALAFSPDGKRLAVAEWTDKQPSDVKVWDVTTDKLMLILHGHTGPVTSVGFSPNGTRIVTGSFDQTIKLWDAETGEEVFTLRGHASGILSVAFSGDGERIVSGSIDGAAKLWDATTAKGIIAPLAARPVESDQNRDLTRQTAGKDGKDLGADVDLVGPGEVYERWKKTPEYQEWLKETGQEK